MKVTGSAAWQRIALAVVIPLLSVAIAGAQVTREASSSKVPTGRGWGQASDAAPAARTASTNGIAYHGGPLMLNTPNIYFIWYGCWQFSGQTCTPSHSSDGQGTVSLVNTFFGSLGGSGYELINSTYFDGSNNYVSGNVNTAASAQDNYSQGKRLSDSKVRAVVSRAINNGSVPSDSNGLYFVLTSSDVSETSGFCSSYCGWHDHTTMNGTDIKFSFVGNPDRCPRACEDQTTSPNGNSGADGMVNIMAHEQEEAISDPDLNAWYDSAGEENADKCAWRFGPTKTAGNGSLYNETIGGLNWLVQMNWQNACGGGCAQSGTLHQTSGCVFY